MTVRCGPVCALSIPDQMQDRERLRHSNKVVGCPSIRPFCKDRHCAATGCDAARGQPWLRRWINHVWFRRAVADRVQTDTRISGSPGPARSSPVPVLGSPVPASSCQVSTEGRPQDRSWVHMGRVPRAVGPVQKTNPDVDREWPPGVSRAKLSWHGRASCSRCCRAGVCRGNRPGRAGAPDTVPDTVQIRSRYGSDTVQIRF